MKDLSNGNGNGKTGGEVAPLPTGRALEGKDFPRPDRCRCSTPLEVLNDGVAVRCPTCKATKMLGAVAPAAAIPVERPMTALELVQRLCRGCCDQHCEMAHAALCSTFGPTDANDSSRSYLGIVNRVKRGTLSPAVVVRAFKQATDPSAENPGRVFTHNIKKRVPTSK